MSDGELDDPLYVCGEENRRLEIKKSNWMRLAEEQAKRITELEAAIRDAPHEDYCETSLTNGHCDCWKRVALEKGEWMK